MKISPTKTALKMEISALQAKHEQELLLCKEQAFLVFRGLTPLGFLKTTIAEILSSPDIKKNLLNYLFELTAGYVSKKIVITATSNPIKKVINQVLQFALKSVMPSSADSYADSE